jgi:hypothetical protein
VKETNAAIHHSANTADEEKHSYSDLTAVASRAYLPSQRGSYEGKCKTGSPRRIPLQITISHARLTTRERRPGFSKAVSSNSGSRLRLFCGSMANVCPFFSIILHPTEYHICSGLRQKCFVVRYFLLFFPASTHIIVLSSEVIQDIVAQHEAGLMIMAYFYCDFRNEDKQNCRNLVLSLVAQLCAQSDIFCDTLSRIYSAHNDGARKPSDETLINCHELKS